SLRRAAPSSPLFPYPPLFRSARDAERVAAGARLRRPRPAGAPGAPPSLRLAPDVEYAARRVVVRVALGQRDAAVRDDRAVPVARSEEHTSELQSRGHLVCRLL